MANWSDTGTFAVTNGTLDLQGSYSTPGAITRTGGTIRLGGTWNHTGNPYTLTSTTGIS